MKRPALLIASRNHDKVREIAQVLSGLDIDLIAADQVDGVPPVIEDQPTLEGNAIKKARTLSKATGMLALADDTGLEVDALEGAPGVRSSRYAGEGATYADNVVKLLAEMEEVPGQSRTARFRCVIALADGDAVETVEGVCQGRITTAATGEGGFGYDPVFLVPELDRTFAQMTPSQKNAVSHRGIALRNIRRLLRQKLGA